MGLTDSINNFLGLCNVGACPYRITVLGSLGVYVEGVEKICNLKKEEIVIKLKNATLLIQGENLSIGSFIDRDLTVRGKVEKILWQE